MPGSGRDLAPGRSFGDHPPSHRQAPVTHALIAGILLTGCARPGAAFQQVNANQVIYWIGGGASNFDTYAETGSNQTNIPVGAMWTVQCDGAGTLVIRGGSNVNIRYWAGDGSTPADADVTVARGGVATVRKVADDTYDVWGIGLS